MAYANECRATSVNYMRVCTVQEEMEIKWVGKLNDEYRRDVVIQMVSGRGLASLCNERVEVRGMSSKCRSRLGT